jgi:Flp pilus assembly protein TadG
MVDRLRCQRGQAIVEFVIVLPLLFALIFLLVYAAIGFNRQLLVTDAARVAARAGVVARFDSPPQEPCAAATSAATDLADGMTISVNCATPEGDDPGDPFSVTVSYVLDVQLPLLPLTDLDIESTATERLE